MGMIDISISYCTIFLTLNLCKTFYSARPLLLYNLHVISKILHICFRRALYSIELSDQRENLNIASVEDKGTSIYRDYKLRSQRNAVILEYVSLHLLTVQFSVHKYQRLRRNI